MLDQITQRQMRLENLGISPSFDAHFLALGFDLVSLNASVLIIHGENIVHLSRLNYPLHFSKFQIMGSNFPKEENGYPICLCSNGERGVWLPLLDVDSLTRIVLGE